MIKKFTIFENANDENKKTLTTELTIDGAIDWIRKKCPGYGTDYGVKLYRGLKNTDISFGITRAERRNLSPNSTYNLMLAELETWAKLPSRLSSVFFSPSTMTAGIFGKLYIVIPPADATVCALPTVDMWDGDLFDRLSILTDDPYTSVHNFYTDYVNNGKPIRDILSGPVPDAFKENTGIDFQSMRDAMNWALDPDFARIKSTQFKDLNKIKYDGAAEMWTDSDCLLVIEDAYDDLMSNI
jgi:hypothetical protein